MKNKLISLLKSTERYTKTDMVYLASGAFWGNFNSAVVAILAFVASIFFARYLTKDQYGMYQYVLSIAGLIGATTLTGMNSAVVRAVARGHEGELRHAVRFQLAAGIVPALVGFGVSTWYFAHGNHDFGLLFAWIALMVPLANAFNTWVAYLGGKKMFRVGSYYGFANNLASYLPIIAAIFFARDYMWVVVVNYLFMFLSSFVLYNVAIRRIPPNAERDNETVSYGVHLSLMGVLGTIAAQIDSLLVFHFIGSAALAVYSFATVIPERLAGMLKAIPNIALPKLSERTEEQVRQILKARLWMLISLLAIVAAAYAAIAPWFFHVFFPQYADSVRFTQLYSLSFFSLAALTVQMALMSQKKTRELYVFNTAMPIVRIALMAGLMFLYGIWGLLWAQIATNFISLGFQLALVFRRSPAAQSL